MRWITRTLHGIALAAILALVGSGSAPAMSGEKESAKEEGAANAQVLREIAIMAKVLETRLKGEFSGELVTDGIFQRGGVRGFRVPGVGAVFQFNVEFPVAERKPPEQPDEPKKDDLWSRIERGGSVGGAVSEPFGGGYGMFRVDKDPYVGAIYGRSARGGYGGFGGGFGAAALSKDHRQKIEKLEDVILKTLAEYGGRMTALDDNEHIIILAGGGGKRGPAGTYSYYATDPMSAMSGRQTGGLAETVAEDIEVTTEVEADEGAKKLRELHEEIGQLEKRLREQLDNKEAEDLERIQEDLKAVLEDYRKQAQHRDGRVNRRRTIGQPGKTKETRRIVVTTKRGLAPSTTWTFKVRKGDLVDDPDDLRKAAEIHSY